MAAANYPGFHLWMNTDDSIRLLPQFRWVQEAHKGWAAHLSAEDKAKMQAGAKVSRALARAIGKWVFDEVQKTLWGRPDQWWRTVEGCRHMCKTQCRGTAIGLDSAGYGRILIGTMKDPDSKVGKVLEIRECVHRLVCWARWGMAEFEAGKPFACHTGVFKGSGQFAGRRGCKGSCVQSNHLQWGTPSDNRREQVARARYRAYNG
mgnify:CR=1 FL=1